MMQQLEMKVIDIVHAVDDDLRTAKEENSDANMIEKYEKNLIQVQAKLLYVAEEAEALLKKHDKRLRAQTEDEHGMCNKEKTF